MGWVASACDSKNNGVNPRNYLEIYVSPNNNFGIYQVKKFMQYLDYNITGITKEMKVTDRNDIIIRFYDSTGKLIHLYEDIDLNEEKYGQIITKINKE